MQLINIYRGPLNIEINLPASGIHMIGLTTSDYDLVTLAVHNVTYRVDEPIYTNRTSFVINPANSQHLYAIQSLNCCLILNYTYYVECHPCKIGKY